MEQRNVVTLEGFFDDLIACLFTEGEEETVGQENRGNFRPESFLIAPEYSFSKVLYTNLCEQRQRSLSPSCREWRWPVSHSRAVTLAPEHAEH